MNIDLHVLQNFAPANLNRDDTGAPKDCEFGGFRRARISSQCLKRSIRQVFSEYALFGDATEDVLAVRTRRLVEETVKRLVDRGKLAADSAHVVSFVLQIAKFKVDEDYKTQYLIFMPRRTIHELANLVLEHWNILVVAASQNDDAGMRRTKSAEQKAAKEALPKAIGKAVEKILVNATKTPDLALFGRMIADNPDWNIDAACQVAHALSTNRANIEFDFYTAVDDFRPLKTTGADMMGTFAFQSSCFYRYANVDVDALKANLGGTEDDEDHDLTKKTVEAFLRASALAIPAGKQNSMGAQNRPSYLLAVVRKSGPPQSLANAFVKPVRAAGEQSLVEASVEKLESYLDRSLGMWGDEPEIFACAEVDTALSARPRRSASFDGWIGAVMNAVAP